MSAPGRIATARVLDLLAIYRTQDYRVYLELGLQTAQVKTLMRINRGHNFSCYRKIAHKARLLGLEVC